jgi:hypothetical protein
MNKVQLSCSFIALMFSAFSSPASAQDQQQQLVGSILKQIDLKSGFSTPDELNEALEPYSNCLITESGAELRDASGNKVQTGPPGGCATLRVQAISRANDKLTQLGIQSSKDRMFIIDMSLGAIEVTADANRKWMEVQRNARNH